MKLKRAVDASTARFFSDAGATDVARTPLKIQANTPWQCLYFRLYAKKPYFMAFFSILKSNA